MVVTETTICLQKTNVKYIKDVLLRCKKINKLPQQNLNNTNNKQLPTFSGVGECFVHFFMA